MDKSCQVLACVADGNLPENNRQYLASATQASHVQSYFETNHLPLGTHPPTPPPPPPSQDLPRQTKQI